MGSVAFVYFTINLYDGVDTARLPSGRIPVAMDVSGGNRRIYTRLLGDQHIAAPEEFEPPIVHVMCFTYLVSVIPE